MKECDLERKGKPKYYKYEELQWILNGSECGPSQADMIDSFYKAYVEEEILLSLDPA